MKNQRILAIHLLNDFSGSPFVFRQSLEALQQCRANIHLFSATPGNSGFLSNIPGVTEQPLYYRWSKNKWVTLALFCWFQCRLFVKLVTYIRKNDLVYINSLLPFGAALAGKLRGVKVVYHIHETSIQPPLLKKLLLFVANRTADKGIFVSHDLMSRTPFQKTGIVVHNALPEAFTRKAMDKRNARTSSRFSVLMICSLKAYKGVFEFMTIARKLPLFSFQLVLNATEKDIAEFFKETGIPKNVTVFPTQQNVHPFYEQTDVVMNLSRPDQWVETFGMTILEAMYYRRPVIVPPVGGVAELVTDGVEGFHVNAYQTDEIAILLQEMAADHALYRKLSAQAFSKAHSFTHCQFRNQIQQALVPLHRFQTLNNMEKAGIPA